MSDKVTEKFKEQFIASIDKVEKVEIGMQLCEIFTVKGNFTEARIYGLEAFKNAKILNDLDKCYNLCSTIARSYAFQGFYLKSKEFFEKSMYYAEKTENQLYIAKACNNLGNVTYNSTDPQNALNYYFKAINICEANCFYDLLIKLYNNLGNIFRELNQYSEAIEYFKKALSIIEHSSNPERLYYYIGTLYRDQKKYTSALKYLNKSHKILKTINDIYYLVHCQICIGEVYFGLNDYKKAKKYAMKVFDYALKYDLIDHFSSACLLLADVYQVSDDLNKAHYYYTKIEEKLGSIQSSSHLLNFYHHYNVFCFKMNDEEKAYHYLSKFVELKNKLLNEEFIKNVTMLKETFNYEQKKKEAEIYRLRNIELVNSQKMIEEQKSKLVTLNDEKDTILSIISHDLTNYLGTMQSTFDTALLKTPSIFEDRYFNIANELCHRAFKLVKDLLYTQKLNSVENVAVIAEFDVNKLLNSYIDIFEFKANTKNIKLQFNISKKPITCLLDVSKWHRIIENIFSNAVKYTHEGGKIIITSKKINKHAVITIKDTGIGIESSDLPKLFSRFTSISKKGTAGETSTGLGLYIVKSLVDIHNGAIDVVSNVGEGTEFILKFPCL